MAVSAIAVLGVVISAAGETESSRAEAIIESSGVKAGLCVHLGVTDGRLTAGLAAGGRFLVHGLAADAIAVERARKHIREQGTCGKVSVERSDFRRLPYAENLVNLVVADDFPSLLAKGVSLKEVMRVLAPNGVAMLGRCERKTLTAAGIKSGETCGVGGVPWIRIAKPRPAGMDDWPQWRYGPSGNGVSHDTLVGKPERLRWIAGPTWSRSHGLPGSLKAMVSAGGRVFYVYDEAPTSVAGPPRLRLVARDAYNGVLLWKRPMVSVYQSGSLKGRAWPFKRPTLAAVGDTAYAVLEPNGRLTALDGATGRIRRVYDKAASPNRVVWYKGALVLAEGTVVRALDAETGRPLWRRDTGNANVVVGDGRVYLQVPWGRLACLDARTGEEQWRRVINTPGKEGSVTTRRLHLCFYANGVLVFGEGYAGRATYGFSAADGRHLWRYAYRPVYNTTDAYAVGGLVWVHAKEGARAAHWCSIGLNPMTGTAERRIEWPASYARRTGHHRCYPNRATERFFLLGSRNIDLVDWRAGKAADLRIARGDCAFGILPANGLVYAPPHPCTCDAKSHLRGLLALAPADESTGDTTGERSERGPAFGPSRKEAPKQDDDWPTYRHDGWRSGGTTGALPVDLHPLWQARLRGRLSGVTVAGGKVTVAEVDAHRVVALDARDGRRLWDFTAGGRVDSPPTIDGGLALFGSNDGWVTCLRASDGALVWRFRAAPAERRIVAFGQLESPWPVHGSVLVKDGTAFFCAGRAADVGGLFMYALDAATGKVIWQKRPEGLNDIVTTDEGQHYVHLRRTFFQPKTGEKPRYYAGYPIWAGSGFLEASWPSRSRWRFRYSSGELLVHDRTRTFAVRAFHGNTKNARTKVGNGEYTLLCRRRLGGRKEQDVWSVKVPVRPTALALTGETLLAAGIPDRAGGEDHYAAFDGTMGGDLWVFSTVDGKKLSTRKLAAPPVYDGLAGAGGRLYISCQDGVLRCFGKK